MKMLLIPKISYFIVGSQKVCPKIDLATNHMTSERLTSKCNNKAIVGKMYTESLQPKLSLIVLKKKEKKKKKFNLRL